MESIHITFTISTLGNDTIEAGTQLFNAETLWLKLNRNNVDLRWVK